MGSWPLPRRGAPGGAPGTGRRLGGSRAEGAEAGGAAGGALARRRGTGVGVDVSWLFIRFLEVVLRFLSLFSGFSGWVAMGRRIEARKNGTVAEDLRTWVWDRLSFVCFGHNGEQQGHVLM